MGSSPRRTGAPSARKA